MSAIAFRQCRTPEDFARIAEVFSRVYNSGNPVDGDDIQKKPYDSFVGERDGSTVCGFAILNFHSQVRESIVPCAGIAAVGVLPEHRRGGAGGELMRFAVEEMRRRGQPLSSLYAFREPFYRKFGFEVAGKRLELKAPIDQLKGTNSPLPIRKLSPEDWREIDPCYREFSRLRSGLNLRNAELWRRVLAENRPLAVYVAGDPVEAYAVISHNGGFWTDDRVSEFAWSSLRGHRSIIDFIRGLGINKRSFAWYEPSDSPTYASSLDEGFEVKVARPIMWRVNDVPAALALLSPAGHGETILEVLDPVMAENQGPWLVSWSNGRCEVSPCTKAGVRLSIQEFSQAYMGDPSVDDFVRWGRLDGNDPMVATLGGLLTRQSVYCLDFF